MDENVDTAFGGENMDTAFGGENRTPLAAKKSSPTMSSFSATQLIPEMFPSLDSQDDVNDTSAITEPMSSSNQSADGPSVFDHGHEPGEYENPTQSTASSPGAQSVFDLMPPPPNVTFSNAEVLSRKLFSVDHLNLVLRHQPSFSQFTAFLNQYRPRCAPTLIGYLETRKAMAAVDYANAITKQMWASEKRYSAPAVAATLGSRFEARSRRALEELVNDALPAYITHRLVQVTTEILVKEITGNSAPVMRELVEGLAEVYCMTDPSLPDNPIVYASEEFHNMTQYGRDYVIGRNCRFLQGHKSAPSTVARISEAIRQGQEICETLLNYRRDGSPFLNLCLVAPLYDNRGIVRYFIGCQINVTRLVEGGKGLESFQQLLDQDQGLIQEDDSSIQKPSLRSLGDLSELLSTEEMEVLRQRGRTSSSRASTPAPRPTSSATRRFLGIEEAEMMNIWPPTRFSASGRSPGVYQNFLLVRPYPSLRITFTSAALRIPGLVQSRLLDHIDGPQSMRQGIQAALVDGVRVTAQISWLTSVRDGSGILWSDDLQSSRNNSRDGKPRWIHCTPLIGSDGHVGVWMVIMVEQESITGRLNAHLHRLGISANRFGGAPRNGGRGEGTVHFSHDKLHAEDQRRGGRDSNGRGTFLVDEEDEGLNGYAEYLRNSSARSGSLSRAGSRATSGGRHPRR